MSTVNLMKVASPILEDTIRQKIYRLRNRRVMLDRDLAILYGVETRVLNQAVKRNQKRFPSDFMFVLSRPEIGRISQFVTSLKFSKNVLAFTEQGVAMLSTVLKSERAIGVNIEIMRTFVKIKEAMNSQRTILTKLAQIESRVKHQDIRIESIFETIRELIEPPPTPIKPKPKIGFHP